MSVNGDICKRNPGLTKALYRENNVVLLPQKIGFHANSICQMWTIYSSNTDNNWIMKRYNASDYLFHNMKSRKVTLNFKIKKINFIQLLSGNRLNFNHVTHMVISVI